MAQEATAGGRREYLKTPREVLVQGTKSLKAKETPVQSEDTESNKREPATTGSSVTKRRRAKTPKSRTGCRTCKIRRVKCDEAKPSCLRCIKFGAACNGYDFIAQETHRQPRQLLPHSSGNLTVNITPITAVFQDQLEYQYFLHFRDEITLDLSGTIPQPMWDCVILRACNDSLPLRHLTSSIAALSKARSCSPTGEGNEHRVFAARFYGKALRGIQELINTTNETDAARLTLLASLLIFCFESLQGEYANAVDHIKVAMGMMRNRFSTSRRQYSLIRKLAPIPGLEDELVDIFVRIDNTLMVKANATGDRGILDMRYESEDGYMLSAFRDLGEAKNYLEHHMFCAMPYLARLPDIFMHGAQLSSVEEEETGAQLLEQLRHWNAAFAPLFASARKSPTSQDFIAAASLRCLKLVAEISVRKILAPVGIVDEFMEEATEIVDLSRRIVTDSGFKKTFVFECGILPALFITVMLCPKRSVRMDIIQVLKLAEGRVEVTWDAIEVARMAKFFMGAEGGDPEPALKLNASMGELFERKDQVQADSYSRGLDLAESELRATS